MRQFRLLLLLCLFLFSCEKDNRKQIVDTDSFFAVLDAKEEIRLDKEFESTVYARKGLFWFKQYLDKEHPEAGTYEQRVVVAHKGFDRPTLFLTEGYSLREQNFEADAVLHEISEKLNLNVVYAEHRYYGESLCPEDTKYTYLTVKSSADDLHKIYELLSPYYSGKWLSAGTSKNGMTAMFYQMFYPEDMALAVPFCAPMPHAPADTRHYSYIHSHVGTPQSRKEIEDFIVDMLERRAEMMPFILAELEAHPEWKYKFSADELYDLILIDYYFVRWQYNTMSKNPIPGPDASAIDHIIELFTFSYVDVFSYTAGTQFYKPYTVQCVKELSSYLMDWDPELKERIKGLTVYQAVENLYSTYLLPEGTDLTGCTPGELSLKVEDFYRRNDPPVLFIYSQPDPWTAMGLTDESYFSGKQNMHLYIHPGDDHNVQISDFPESSEIFNIISEAVE